MSKIYNSKTVAVTARPRSQRLREAGGWYAAAVVGKNAGSNGSQTLFNEGSSGLFEEVLDANGIVIGIKPLHDLLIIQTPGDETAGTEDELRNITKVLCLQEIINLGTETDQRYGVRFAGGLISEGDVVAYGTTSEAISPTAYDRLDPVGGQWPSYDGEKLGWILSAALGWNLDTRIKALEDMGALSIGQLTDVDMTGANDGQALVYQSGVWRPVDIATASADGHTHANLATLDGITQEKVDAWDEIAKLFTASRNEEGITGINALYPLSVAGNIIADGDVVAYGPAGSAVTPAAYDRLDPVGGQWPSYDGEKLGWVLSAALGWDLNARASALESRVTDLESNPVGPGTGTTDHTHANLATLDDITQEKVDAWDEIAKLFTASHNEEDITGINALYPLSVAGNITADGDVVAYGAASGVPGPVAYDRLDPVDGLWPVFDPEKAGWVLSAALGWNLDARVVALEAGGPGSSGHSHSNLAILESITAERVAVWDSGISGGNSHEHENLAVLNNITSSKVSSWDSAASGAHSHSNKSVLDGITSGKVSAWDSTASSAHSHLNKSVLDGITSGKVSAWDSTASSAHSHSNKSVLDGITSGKVSAWDSAASGAHSHSNKSVLDGITSGKVSAWDSAASGAHNHSNKSVLDGITSDKVSAWDSAASGAHNHSNKSVLDGITSSKVSAWDSAASNAHGHSNKSVLDGITSSKVSAWDSAAFSAHGHSNKSVLDGITSSKVSAWDAVAGTSYLPLAGGTLTGSLTGPAATFGSITLRNGYRSATISIDSSGRITINTTVRATGDIVAYSS